MAHGARPAGEDERPCPARPSGPTIVAVGAPERAPGRLMARPTAPNSKTPVATSASQLDRDLADAVDEREGQALFEGLHRLDRNARRRRVFARLATAEARHAAAAEARVRAAGAAPPPYRPSWRLRFLLAWARLFGPVAVLPWVASMEDADAERYRRRAPSGQPPPTPGEERANADALAEFARIEAGEAAKRLVLRIRRIVLPVVGGALFLISAVLMRNVQIEGLVFGLLTGVIVGPVVHYVIGKLAVPLAVGRVWCGWACWTAAVLDQLPFRRAAPWRPLRHRRLRTWHLGAVVVIVTALVLAFGYDRGAVGPHAAAWFLAGNAAYWALAVAMAVALRDNRAFCKYACPVAVLLRVTSRPALLKLTGDPAACAGCASRACTTVCPMGVDVPSVVAAGDRVGGGECIACLQCMAVCPPNALQPSIGFDATWTDRLVETGGR